jgi:beta-N-acetylhexosaminidase
VAAATIRRRRLAAGAVCGLAVGAFAFGVALGDGSGQRPSAASQLTPDQLAGQRIVAGLEGLRVPASLRRLIREGRVAGVVLYADNFPSRAAARRLIRGLQAIPRPPELRDPLLVLTDQEGGLVKRIDGAPAASAREMASRGPAFSREQGRLTALNLRDVGVNVNLAPVLDVARPGSAITETAREWGHTAGRVVAGAIPFAVAMQDAGVAAVAKHFPGIGAVRGNTDSDVQRIPLSMESLRRVDEAPFRSFAEAGGAMVMLSAAIYPSFSPKPALFSRPIVTGELRRRLGFEGVAITDALDTASALSAGGPAEAGVAAVRAGADLLLYTEPGPAAEAQRALAQRLRSGALSRDSFEESADRVLQMRDGLGSPSR